jgi:hypothetical protein
MTARDAPMLRATVWRTSFLQGAVCITGAVMAWHAAECAVLGHHGHACLCAIGVMINLLSYDIAAGTRALALTALDADLA